MANITLTGRLYRDEERLSDLLANEWCYIQCLMGRHINVSCRASIRGTVKVRLMLDGATGVYGGKSLAEARVRDRTRTAFFLLGCVIMG